MAAEILNEIELPSGTVRLHDWMSGEVVHGHNLVMSRDGREIWKASPPEGGADCFTGVYLEDGVLTAYTWSCFKVTLDSENGRILSSVFTK